MHLLCIGVVWSVHIGAFAEVGGRRNVLEELILWIEKQEVEALAIKSVDGSTSCRYMSKNRTGLRAEISTRKVTMSRTAVSG